MTVGLWVRLEAKAGRERDLENFLRSAVPLVEAEPGTLVWFGVRLSARTFGIFDAFADEAARQAHLAGRVAAALAEHAGTLLAEAPVIERLDVVATKVAKEPTTSRVSG